MACILRLISARRRCAARYALATAQLKVQSHTGRSDQFSRESQGPQFLAIHRALLGITMSTFPGTTAAKDLRYVQTPGGLA